jgi:hypothetical protein
MAEQNEVVRRWCKGGMMSPEGRRPWSDTPSREDVERVRGDWESPSPQLPGVDLNAEQQLDFLQKFGRTAAEVQLATTPDEGWRFYHPNGFYGLGDALVLLGVMRHLSPKRVIEIGCGFSSAVMLDANERFLDGQVAFTLIDPFPDSRLSKLLRPGDLEGISIIQHFLQEVDLSMFESLEGGDILFIDSSHVSKMGSDVNILFFEVIPRLPVGAWIHFHDILYPFEYPPESIDDKRAWSEAYLLRAFLEHNDSFRICFFFDYLRRFHRGAVERALPGSIASRPAHIWLERVS